MMGMVTLPDNNAIGWCTKRPRREELQVLHQTCEGGKGGAVEGEQRPCEEGEREDWWVEA